jgi:hypothetical protein
MKAKKTQQNETPEKLNKMKHPKNTTIETPKHTK